MQSISKFVSYLFHPLLIPTFGIVLLFNTGSYLSYLPFNAQRAIYIIVFISTFILPLSFMPFFLYTEKVTSIFLHKQKERLIPLIITVVFYSFSFYILTNLNAPKIIRLFILGTAISVLVALAITFFWKISTHAIGIGGLLALAFVISFRLMVDLNFIVMILIFICGVVGTARIYLNAHNVLQVISGIIIGFTAIFLPFQFF
jgi:membrane-associated phospholipid phosphatase